MVFLSAQPHDSYFAWQIEVQIVNFRKFGISDRMHVLIWYPDNDLRAKRGEPLEPLKIEEWKKIAEKYREVKFYFYMDKGLTVPDFKLYIPQLRPQILAKHFDAHPELKDEVIFYHDSDIIFQRAPDFNFLAEGITNWQSDTSGYLDYNYLLRKEEQGKISKHEAISKLCQIGNISIETMASYASKTGGAQYILKDIDGDFWRDVERQVIDIRKAFMYSEPNSINSKYFPSENEGFQSWCADMWAVNMALWSRGKITDITKELDFSWATDSAETYHQKPIYHNAGSNGRQSGIFHKGAWINKSPLYRNHAVRKDSASWFYVQAIKDVHRN